MANDSADSVKSGFTLAMIPMLDGADDWLDFADGIETFLIMNNLYDYLESYRDKPQGNNAASREWLRKHRFAISALKARSNYNGKKMITGIESYHEAYTKLEKNYKPQGDGTFRELSDKFFTVTLSDYKSVDEYTKTIKKLTNQLAALGVTIPEPLVILRYLQGLGSAYSTFYTSFTTTNQILPGEGSEENEGVSFDFIALKTRSHEKTLAQQDSATALAATSTVNTVNSIEAALVANSNTRTIDVPYCTHCNKLYHTKDKCFVLYPTLITDIFEHPAPRASH